ncbi:MAG: hypothetical protein A2939_05470 [Parcubacteria group bacterium RIFCSPLOWO2_01_FULL_48_18]|nr:MAG: hypothetical protein A2939_05470 [Parcubacteria group bacterium RIFCSPLOWO2_01_FULL_48_18]
MSIRGFSFVELLLYVSLFVIGSIFLVGILYSSLRIQGRESAAVEVTDQSNFIMQTIQRLVRNASLIEDASSSLILRMEETAKDPTRIFVNSNIIYVKEGSGADVALTDSKTTVDQLTFTKFSNPPAKDTVQINLTLSYNTTDPTRAFTKTLRSAISKVSAVTFDSDLLPNASGKHVGASGQKWQDGYFAGNTSIDGTISVGSAPFFYVNPASSLVGIGVGTSPTSAFHVTSSAYLQIGFRSSATASDCDAAGETGRLFFLAGSVNKLAICDGTQWRYATTTTTP